MAKTRLIIASPSPVHRSRLARMAQATQGIEVIAVTGDLPETFTKSEALEPDVVLMSEDFCKVDEWTAMKSLFYALGTAWLVAVPGDSPSSAIWSGRFAGEPMVFASSTKDQLWEAVQGARQICKNRVAQDARGPVPEPAVHAGPLVVIGASTGGVDALLTLLSDYPINCPPTLLVQHTGQGFSEGLVRLLDRRCRPAVVQARDGLPLVPGQVVVGAGSKGHVEVARGTPNRCRIRMGEPISGHTPSVDAMFQSAVPLAPNVVGVILTGMGQDGAAGLLSLQRAGCPTIGQDEATSVVYGMPRAAFNLGAVRTQLPIDRIGTEILRLCQSGPEVTIRSRSAAR